MFKRYLPFFEVPEWFEELAVRPDGLLQLLHWIYSYNAVEVVLPGWKEEFKPCTNRICEEYCKCKNSPASRLFLNGYLSIYYPPSFVSNI